MDGIGMRCGPAEGFHDPTKGVDEDQFKGRSKVKKQMRELIFHITIVSYLLSLELSGCRMCASNHAEVFRSQAIEGLPCQ